MFYVDIFAQLPGIVPLIQLSKQLSSSEQALNIWIFTVELAFKCINATCDNLSRMDNIEKNNLLLIHIH